MRSCGATLQHAHGHTECDLPTDHEDQHSGWCDLCQEHGYDDPSDRLNWDRDGESWVDLPRT